MKVDMLLNKETKPKSTILFLMVFKLFSMIVSLHVSCISKCCRKKSGLKRMNEFTMNKFYLDIFLLSFLSL